MKTTMQDFYGQQITIHNETSTGNLRFKVETCKSLNDVYRGEFDVETDLSLNEHHVDVLIGALSLMREKMGE